MVLNEDKVSLQIDCIVQARMGSTRLPGKVLLNIDESHRIIDFLIDQLNQTRINRLIIAIPDSKENDVLENYLKKLNVICFRGNELDLLDRQKRTIFQLAPVEVQEQALWLPTL